ncbi:precorrin-8X methylmutase [Orenia metallireducens]|uniref:Precorrin-8X methylmutase n=1 Tax=Orenia metallireducens TaxID=1413210 RepID=A0A285GNX7_9FIRM|nr:precorrin-8X methylmutase [Orenia metallireducens]PRX29842.1 precorrin-8X methylmutase [Orenia metallireducens]SNY25269.1 precorrin-8X methylmutase [Orenia metallireducens]
MDFNKDPKGIEVRSMEIITEEVGDLGQSPQEDKVIKRVIHATADLEFAKLVVISKGAIEAGLAALKSGANIVTDVNMLKSGITKGKSRELNIKVDCFISNQEIATEAKKLGITRSMMSMRRAAQDKDNKVFAIGNAPTALFELIKLVKEGKAEPELIIGTPVGFVGAKESKEELEKLDIPYITVRGRKGGSPVAASIVNALLYMC